MESLIIKGVIRSAGGIRFKKMPAPCDFKLLSDRVITGEGYQESGSLLYRLHLGVRLKAFKRNLSKELPQCKTERVGILCPPHQTGK